MKTLKILMIPAIVLLILFSATPSQAYTIEVQFMSGTPMIFPVGRLVPGDFSDASDINFRDIDPFFQMILSDPPEIPEDLILLVRLETTSDVLFTVTSSSYDFSQFMMGHPYNNQELSTTPGLNLGQGEEVNANRLMPYIDGGNLRQGYYILTVVLSEHDNWDLAIGDNQGIATEGIQVYNPSQVDLIEPMDLSILTEYPIFLWSFPRREGVTFLLELVSGSPDDDPSTVMEFANPANEYASISIDIQPWQQGGDMSSYTYTGVGEERPLDLDSTYFWRITAKAPTMFPSEYEDITSPVYRFTYKEPQGEGGGASEIPGQSGDESPPPSTESPIFSLLQEYLPAELFQMLIDQFGSFEGWSVNPDRCAKIDGKEYSLAELTQFFQEHSVRIILVAAPQ